MNKNRKSKNKRTDDISISAESKKIGKDEFLWRSTLIKIAQLRYNGLQVTMKSYTQIPRSHIDSNVYKYQDPTPEQEEF